MSTSAYPIKWKHYSGFKTKKEEMLYDRVSGSLLRLLSMRLAIQFTITMPVTEHRRGQKFSKEDEKLKVAIG